MRKKKGRQRVGKEGVRRKGTVSKGRLLRVDLQVLSELPLTPKRKGASSCTASQPFSPQPLFPPSALKLALGGQAPGSVYAAAALTLLPHHECGAWGAPRLTHQQLNTPARSEDSALRLQTKCNQGNSQSQGCWSGFSYWCWSRTNYLLSTLELTLHLKSWVRNLGPWF